MKISAHQVAIICPTKDRPENVTRLLSCIANLDEKPGQILVADGGCNLNAITESYRKQLNLTCLYCPQAGQIFQRNHAHQHLNGSIKLVLHIDDDHTFAANFMTCLIKVWNREAVKPGRSLAGISVNVTNTPRLTNDLFCKIFLRSTKSHGGVSIAGYASPLGHVQVDHDVEWLAGGSTAWSRDIIDKHPHPISFPMSWAICEDVIYSYPLHRNYRLIATARVLCLHNDTYKHMSLQQGIFYGVSSAIMRYHFVRQHDELKTWAYLWMTLGILIGNLAKGLLFSPQHLGLFLGGLNGFARVLLCCLFNCDSSILAKALAKRKR